MQPRVLGSCATPVPGLVVGDSVMNQVELLPPVTQSLRGRQTCDRAGHVLCGMVLDKGEQHRMSDLGSWGSQGLGGGEEWRWVKPTELV